jgi:hypothetical protein
MSSQPGILMIGNMEKNYSMNYIAINKKDTRERARSKAFARLTMLHFDIENNKNELKSGDYGAVTREEVELILEGNKIEKRIWNYITELIEKSDK